MPKGRPVPPLNLTDEERNILQNWSRSRSMASALVQRARIVLLSDQGLSNTHIAKKLALSGSTVGNWRRRFVERRIEGLHDEFRSGRPRELSEEQLAELLTKTLEQKPKGQKRWSVRSASEETGISKSTVQRIWSALAIKPHQQQTFKLSSDPFFIEKVVDICGLYLNPPDNAMVLCVDEKSQVQALERSQPMLPLGLGYVEGIAHDYYRHGTTTLFAALDIQSGRVLTQCKKRHRHQEFLQFLKHIDQNVPAELDLHLIVDNYATHKHPKVKAFLAQRPKWHIHYTPTYSSWLNQVEIFFGIITRKAIRNESFQSVKELIKRIETFVSAYNKNAKPFVWTATANSIFEKLRRLMNKISGTQH